MSYLFGGIQSYDHDFLSGRTYAASLILSTQKSTAWLSLPSTTGSTRSQSSSKRARKGPRKSEGYAPSSLPSILAY